MRIFFGAPFSKYLDDTGKTMRPEKEQLIKKMLDFLENKGHDVRNAHSREQFGKELMTPDICTKLDLEEIQKCDMFVAMPGNPPSGGVHIELGWASALNKKIVLLLRQEGKYSPLITGLNQVGQVNTVTFKNEKELFEKLEREI